MSKKRGYRIFIVFLILMILGVAAVYFYMEMKGRKIPENGTLVKLENGKRVSNGRI